MKVMTRVALLTGIGCLILVSATASAQRQHAPKGIWIGMLANLSEVQGIASSVTVFDMQRAAKLSKQLTERQHYLANWDKLSDATRKRYSDLAKVTDELHAAAEAGDDQQTSLKLGEVLAGCSSCHYDARDKKRREQMQ